MAVQEVLVGALKFLLSLVNLFERELWKVNYNELCGCFLQWKANP